MLGASRARRVGRLGCRLTGRRARRLARRRSRRLEDTAIGVVMIVSVISAVTLVARRQRLNELSAKKKMNLYYVDRVVVTVSESAQQTYLSISTEV